jgi:hypothetical protein
MGAEPNNEQNACPNINIINAVEATSYPAPKIVSIELEKTLIMIAVGKVSKKINLEVFLILVHVYLFILILFPKKTFFLTKLLINL